MRELDEDGDDLLSDLGEEIEPFEVGREEEGASRDGTEIRSRVEKLELSNR